jgi:outer membrane protein insertion porin family
LSNQVYQGRFEKADAGIADGQPFDKALADKVEQELKRQYINKSPYGVEVTTTVTPGIERNRVNLTFNVWLKVMAKNRNPHHW